MRTFSQYQLWHGHDDPPPEAHEVRAGPLTAMLEGPDLRGARIGAVELIQRVYMAVRDEEWNTVPGEYTDFKYDIQGDRFEIKFVGSHRQEAIDYEWRATIIGTTEGTISYAMDGVANSAFRYNKIGLNVHHPLDSSVGRPYRARTANGEARGFIPKHIDPQRIENGTLTAIFEPYDSLVLTLEGDMEVCFDFEGDLFEMQDHRNWTDANFKSYSTPLAISIPMKAERGQLFHQKVTASLREVPRRVPLRSTELNVLLGPTTGKRLPRIGVGHGNHGAVLSQREADLLGFLRFDHVRADLRAADPSYESKFSLAVETAQMLGAALEIALFLTRNADEELESVASHLYSLKVPVKQILVLEEAEGFSTFRTATPNILLQMARNRLRDCVPGAMFVGGTDQFFTELNRDWSLVSDADGVAYSLNPQVHACDDTSVMENLKGQAATVASAQHFSKGKPVFVSPITFIGRSGPYPAGPAQSTGLPPTVDVRQASLFGAAWSVGSIELLSTAGVASVTYFETTGWKGLIEMDGGSPMPDKFPSNPGGVFPLYHVFADVAQWKEGNLISTPCSDPQAISALGLHTADGIHLLVANLTPRPQFVEIAKIDGSEAQIRRLDEETALHAMTDPMGFRGDHQTGVIDGGKLNLNLSPYAVIRVDIR